MAAYTALGGAPVDQQVAGHPVGEFDGHHPHEREREVDVRERRAGRQHLAVEDEHPVGIELDHRLAAAEQGRHPPRRRRAPPAQEAGLGEGERASAGSCGGCPVRCGTSAAVWG
jgi:hypothetical protein